MCLIFWRKGLVVGTGHNGLKAFLQWGAEELIDTAGIILSSL
jgi:hypothetical protein